MMVSGPSVALPLVQASSIKAYAVVGKDRLAAAPDIPSVDEVGLPGFHLSVWHGLWVPRGTSAEIINKLNAATVATMANAPAIKRFATLGLQIPPREQQTPEALGAYHKAEIEKWWPIIRAANIKAE